MTLNEIARNYDNGNHSDVKTALKSESGNVMESIGRAMAVYGHLGENFGKKQAEAFRDWLMNYSDL